MTVQKLTPRKRFEKYLSITQYAATTIWNATIWHGMNLHVTADDKHVEGHYLLAVATNIRHYAMAEISPAAYLDDGMMDLWLFTGSTLADAFRVMFDILGGQHIVSDQARCIPFHQATIVSETPFSLQLDGEAMLGTQRIFIEILPQKLYVLMPQIARDRLSKPH
jgi:diacylglycerol kinase family enzyme